MIKVIGKLKDGTIIKTKDIKDLNVKSIPEFTRTMGIIVKRLNKENNSEQVI